MKINIKFLILILAIGFTFQIIFWQLLIMIRFLFGLSTTIYETNILFVQYFEIPTILLFSAFVIFVFASYGKQLINEKLAKEGL